MGRHRSPSFKRVVARGRGGHPHPPAPRGVGVTDNTVEFLQSALYCID